VNPDLKDRNRLAASILWPYFPDPPSDDIYIAHSVGSKKSNPQSSSPKAQY
jgi:hypothetical protein